MTFAEDHGFARVALDSQTTVIALKAYYLSSAIRTKKTHGRKV